MKDRPPHLPTDEQIARLREANTQAPVRILMSGCLAGKPVGVDGSTYGEHPLMDVLRASSRVEVISFCPENAMLGTPRPWCDIANGDGGAVLDGRAKVLSEHGQDVTAAFVEGAKRMATLAVEKKAQLAVLMDISAACGSQVIYRGSRTVSEPVRQPGQGVAAAALLREGIPVVSQRDFRTLREIFAALQLPWTGPMPPRDHHETEWYRKAFGNGG